MNKIKKIRKSGFVFIISIAWALSFSFVEAEVALFNDDGKYGQVINHDNFLGGEDWQEDKAHNVYAFSGTASGGSTYLCQSDQRISGFCNDLKSSCNNKCNAPGVVPTDPSLPACDYDDPCDMALLKVYDGKMKDILQAEIDKMIRERGIDVNKGNDAIEECDGEPVCIDQVLSSVQKDPSYAAGSGGQISNDPLSASDVSDFLNNPNTDPPVLNSDEYDPMGVSEQKDGPLVEVAFSNITNNGAVRKLRANAIPGFFENSSDPKDLYFTWYLKKNGCELTDPKYPTGREKNARGEFVKINNDSDASKLSTCDLDFDKIITVNDWKIAAMKIIAAGSFDSSSVNYPSQINPSLSAYKAEPDFTKTENGQDNCYIHSAKTGMLYQLRETEVDFTDSCPDGYERSCIAPKTATCNYYNTAYTAGGTEPFFLTNNVSACSALDPSVENNPKLSCSIKNEDLGNYKTTVRCSNGALPLCVKRGQNSIVQKDAGGKLGEVVYAGTATPEFLSNKGAICQSIAKPDTINGTIENPLYLRNTDLKYPAANQDCSFLRNSLINGIKEGDSTILTGNDDLQPGCTFKKDDSLCKHLFPKLPDEKVSINGREYDLSTEKIGDNSFTIAEKAFWGLDPTKSSTAGVGKDEARLAGLGMDTFEWSYTPGDRIGVVVEGNYLFKSENGDNRSQRIWAFSNGKCEDLEKIESEEDNDEAESRGFYWAEAGVSGVLTAELDLDNCLDENLLNPEENMNSGAEIKLVASPQNPINDPNGTGDTLNISSTSMNFQEPEGLIYKWFVQKSRDGSITPGDATSWIDITDKLIDSGSISETDREGLNKKDLDIVLNIDDIEEGMKAGSFKGAFYLKIKVKITGSAADGGQVSEGSVIVRVKQQENQILVYPISVSDSAMMGVNRGLSGQSLELCANKNDRCYVTKNTIVALEIPEVNGDKIRSANWKVNGNEMACKSTYSSDCSSGNILFLPILGNEGEAVNVVASAINSKNEAVEISRAFFIQGSVMRINILDPKSSCSIQCLSNSSICPKYLGHYNNLSGYKIPDCSYNVWEAKKGSIISLGTSGQFGYDWSIDGKIIPEFRDKDLQFKINKPIGSLYSIKLTSRDEAETNRIMNNIRLALQKHWNIPPQSSAESIEPARMQISVTMGGSEVIASEQKGFAASLITHLSQQMMFLFKITITSVLLFSVMSLLFAFMPSSYREA